MRTADVARVRGEPRVQKTELDRVLARVAALEEGLARRDAIILRQRNEIERLQAENKRLRSERSDLQRQLGEVQGLLVVARKQLEQQGLRLTELERRLVQNSRNSSRPPSTDGPQVERPARGKSKKPTRKRGGQEGHEGKGRELLPAEDVSESFDHRPESCRCCGKPLVGDDPHPERFQTIEIPPVKPFVREDRFHSLTCSCGATTTAEVPAELRGTPFGPRLHSTVALMGGLFRLAKREIQAALAIFFGIEVGLGSIPKMERRMKAALDPPYEEVLQAIRAAPTCHQDTTGWRENKKRFNLWITATTSLAHFRIARQANRAQAQDLLGADYLGKVVTDRTAVQAWVWQQWCWSHLLRDFEALAELRGAQWYGVRLVTCAKRVHAEYRDHAAGLITHAQMVLRLADTRVQVHRLLQAAATRAPAIRARRVAAGILKQEHKLWTFLDHEGVAPTNNLAERCARMAVLWRVSSFGTDSPDGSRYVERILSVVTSLRLQGRSREVLDWLVRARLAQTQPGSFDVPTLLPTAHP